MNAKIYSFSYLYQIQINFVFLKNYVFIEKVAHMSICTDYIQMQYYTFC